MLLKTFWKIIHLLPRKLLVYVKRHIEVVGALDFDKAVILMNLESYWHLGRLRSCEKEPETVHWLTQNVGAGTVFYDVGANVGAYSLIASVLGDRNVQIYAFEPGFATYSDLCKNVVLNGAHGKIVPVPVGIGQESAFFGFQYSDLSSGAASHRWIDSTSGETRGEVGPAMLPTAVFRLDTLVKTMSLKPPTLIKIDVDGAEIGVLKGAEEVLNSPQLSSILIEVGADTEKQITDILSEKGFKLSSRYNRRGEAVNLIFTK